MVVRIVSTILKHTTQGLGTKAKANPKTDKRKQGDLAEDLALSYFLKHGFSLVERNFNCNLGELDIIMRDQDYLVFIEVRYRKNRHFGGALESITPSKQSKLRRAAEVYIQNTKSLDCPCRFDILCLTGNLQQPNYQWIKNAF